MRSSSRHAGSSGGGGRPAARGGRALLAPLLLSLLAGCASALPETPGARREAEIEELKARVTQLAQQNTVNELEIARLRQQLAALEARLGGTARRDGGGAAPAVAPAPVPSRAAAVPAEPAPPRSAPPIEESEIPVESVEVAPAAPVAPVPPAAAAGPLPPVDREAQAVYDEAYTLYHQGRYDEAEARFQEFLAVSPASELSDNAQYWIGASRFARRDFRGALAAFRRTVERYPDENKVPDGLFKMGQTLEELGERAEALTVYDELVRRFPDTAAATLAAERRAAMGR